MTDAKTARSTIWFVDEYCQLFEELFSQVRSFEAFKFLHWGMISQIQHKSLPEIARAIGLGNQQNMHHFLTQSPWEAQQLRQKRLELISKVLNGNTLILLICEFANHKKGKHTDYVEWQYVTYKWNNYIASITAYGLIDGLIAPLAFEVYKPNKRLKEGDKYLTKLEIVGNIIRQLKAVGLVFDLVLMDGELILADSVLRSSKADCIDVVDELKLPCVLTLPVHYPFSMDQVHGVDQDPGPPFKRTFSVGGIEICYRTKVFYEQHRPEQRWTLLPNAQILTNRMSMFYMVASPTINLRDPWRTYSTILYLLHLAKEITHALGWADFRMTNYLYIEKWWEVVMSAFLMISWFADPFNDLSVLAFQKIAQSGWWKNQSGWRPLLSNLGLNIGPGAELTLPDEVDFPREWQRFI